MTMGGQSTISPPPLPLPVVLGLKYNKLSSCLFYTLLNLPFFVVKYSVLQLFWIRLTLICEITGFEMSSKKERTRFARFDPPTLVYGYTQRTLREAAKKVIFFSGPATEKGVIRAWPLKKNTFFGAIKNPPKNVATKFEGGGGGGLSGRAPKK